MRCRRLARWRFFSVRLRLLTFIECPMLMSPVSAILHPQCVKRAQDEIDAVVGQTRMPTFEDEAQLPYVRAMITTESKFREKNIYAS